MSRRDELLAELELLDLEEEFVAAKESGTATAEMREALRAKRQEVREARAAEVAVSPETVTAKSEVKRI